jgi:hypothetical protein
MLRSFVAALAVAGLATGAAAQTRSPAGPKPIVHDLTITTSEGTYSGTMELAVAKGKVTGAMHVTKPTEIKGVVAGTSQAGALKLAFPYHMTERKCDGTVQMELKLPPQKGPAKGTMQVVGCGRDETRKLTGTVELIPRK